MHPIKSFSLIFSLVLSQSALSFERDHSAHEHGHANLAIAIESDELQISFHSPAINIVGFEHEARTDADKEQLSKAVVQLKDVAALFSFNEEAECALESVAVESSLLEDHHEDHHDHGKHEEHDKHEDHNAEHEHEHEEEAHSEFELSYHFECKHIDKLTHVDVNLFKVFPSFEEIDAQVLSHKGQNLVELSTSKTRVKF